MEQKVESLLLLGEGDLTFTQSLSKRMGKTDTKRVVVATSYDSLAQLQAKYHPEIHTTLSRLGKHGFVTVAHEVDATRDLRTQLPLSCIEDGAGFDAVIFNFPHLGVEDARMHRSMLAHMMSCVRSVLREPDGCFFLTLANAQAERWHMLEMAQRNGLVLTDTLAFKESDWPGYNIKRHQSAKSFRNRVSDCSFFVFSRADWLAASASEGAAPRSPKNPFLSLLLSPPAPAPASASPTVGPALGSPEEEGKRRKTDSVPGCKKKPLRPFITATDPLLATQPDGSFQCLACSGKTFATDRAARTHIYSVHVLSAPPSAEEGECAVCGKAFAGADALKQHSVAVHGKHGPARPYWAAASSSASSSSSGSAAGGGDQEGEGECECFVCGLGFPTPELLKEHEQHSARGFAPRDRVEERSCPGCSRGFTDERALLQHLNYCPLASEQKKEEKEEKEEKGEAI